MLLAKNRKALRDYEVVEKFIAGIKLKGYEVKALREGKANFENSYITVRDGRAYVENLHIGRYSNQSQKVDVLEQRRERELLLSKREIEKLDKEVREKAKTAVPLTLLLEHNLIKLELATVKGRKEYEKKHLEKERQIQRDLEGETKALRG